MLVAAGISKSYRRGGLLRCRSLQVLFDTGTELHAGEIVRLVGENGSGKSTLMKILIGSLNRDGGTFTRIRTIGSCPQEPISYERLTPDEHFELFGHAYNLGQAVMEGAEDEILDIFDLRSHRDARVEESSRGTRAKLNLGLALLADPDIFLLDEPHAEFDWDTYLRFRDLTADRKQAGRASTPEKVLRG